MTIMRSQEDVNKSASFHRQCWMTILESNQVGVSHLIDRHPLQAMEAFKVAFNQIRDLSQTDPSHLPSIRPPLSTTTAALSSVQSSSTDSSSSVSTSIPIPMSESTAPLPASTWSPPLSSQVPPTSECFLEVGDGGDIIFCHPLMIDPIIAACERSRLEVHEVLMMVSAAIIFNMALSLHIEAIMVATSKMQLPQHALLDKIMSLYRQCQRLLFRSKDTYKKLQSQRRDGYGCKYIVLMYLALLNNMAHPALHLPSASARHVLWNEMFTISADMLMSQHGAASGRCRTYDWNLDGHLQLLPNPRYHRLQNLSGAQLQQQQRRQEQEHQFQPTAAHEYAHQCCKTLLLRAALLQNESKHSACAA